MKSALRSAIVVDLGFGDSGKGLTVDYLCRTAEDQSRTLVVRASSGHQVGHTVQVDGLRHMYANFSPCVARGVMAYYTKDTTHFIPAMMQEAMDLREKGFMKDLRISVHPLAMLTTPYDILWNHLTERKLQHGSTGVGYGATVVRNNANVTLNMVDTQYEWLFMEKLNGVRYYYEKLAKQRHMLRRWKKAASKIDDYRFTSECLIYRPYIITICKLEDIVDNYSYLIFEGNQGILLDRHDGIYPHTTWATCTSSPALAVLDKLEKSREVLKPELFYVMRSYQTRHGNGPMSRRADTKLLSKDESNHYNEWQKSFRVAELDIELLAAAMRTDDAYIDRPVNRNLMVTCLDQHELKQWEWDTINQRMLPLQHIFKSYSPDSNLVVQM